MNRFEFYSAKREYEEKQNSLKHYGTKGQKWGERHWQNYDGTFNEAGKERYFGSSKPRHKSNKLTIDKDNLNKYSLDELNKMENKFHEEASKLREENDKRDFELASKLANETLYSRYKNENAYDDYMYIKIKAAKEILKENPDLKFDPEHWLEQFRSEENEPFEISNKELNDLDKKIEENYGGSKLENEEYNKKYWEFRHIYSNKLHEESEKINSKIIDKAEEMLKENNYKVDEKEKIEYITKQENYDNWEVEEYKNEDGDRHYGIHKKFNLPNGATVNVKIDKDGSLNKTNDSMKKLDLMFSNFDEIDKSFKDTKYYNTIADYLYANRWNLFKQEGGFRSPYANEAKARKYIMEMSKEEFTDAINKKVVPKLNIKSGDINSERSSFCTAKYGIDGVDGDLEVELYNGGGNIKDLRNIKLDDILD